MALLQCRFCYRVAAPEEKRCLRCGQLLRHPLRPPHLVAALSRDPRAVRLALAAALAGALLLLSVIQLFALLRTL